MVNYRFIGMVLTKPKGIDHLMKGVGANSKSIRLIELIMENGMNPKKATLNEPSVGLLTLYIKGGINKEALAIGLKNINIISNGLLSGKVLLA